MQRKGPTLSGGCRGISNGFPEKGRQESNLEAEQAGARQAGEGGWRCGPREQPLHRPQGKRGPEASEEARGAAGSGAQIPDTRGEGKRLGEVAGGEGLS